MEIDLNQILVIGGIIGTIIASSLGILKFYYMTQDRKPKFTYEKLQEHTGAWRIVILHPDKPINKISIKIDGEFSPLSDMPHRTERTMRAGEGQNFDVPKTVRDDSKVEIIYDKYRIKKSFKDLSLSKQSL